MAGVNPESSTTEGLKLDCVDDFHNLNIKHISLAGRPVDSQWDLCCKNGFLVSAERCTNTRRQNPSHLVIPSLCHPHIHLDKCYLLSHPKYADLKIQKGDFLEALSLTSEAKSRFEHHDLIERGEALIEESINFGVTHIRAFVEVDASVGFKCLDAGLTLKERFKDRCHVQICVFAQDPIISHADDGKEMMALLDQAASREGVEVLGSTPYVEGKGEYDKQVRNIEFVIKTAKKYRLHLDFHIDYNLDDEEEVMVLKALELLHSRGWPSNRSSLDFRTIVFGHCTRLTLFKQDEWSILSDQIGSLPVSFVGLPTSDLYMMGRPQEGDGGGERVRGTLQILDMIERYGLNGAIGINNVGNAFTPQGNCDPLSLATLGVGLYQAGTKQDADVLLACVSSRAKVAIGFGNSEINGVDLNVGGSADFVVFSDSTASKTKSFRMRKCVQDVIYDPSRNRQTIFRGKIVSST